MTTRTPSRRTRKTATWESPPPDPTASPARLPSDRVHPAVGTVPPPTNNHPGRAPSRSRRHPQCR
jgi:hypothetical protein